MSKHFWFRYRGVDVDRWIVLSEYGPAWRGSFVHDGKTYVKGVTTDVAEGLSTLRYVAERTIDGLVLEWTP